MTSPDTRQALCATAFKSLSNAVLTVWRDAQAVNGQRPHAIVIGLTEAVLLDMTSEFLGVQRLPTIPGSPSSGNLFLGIKILFSNAHSMILPVWDS